jgi:hypothetical protein
LWPTLIQQELDTLKDRFNNHVVRKDRNKKLPSGVAPNIAFILHENYGSEDCLQLVNRDIVWGLMQDIGGEDLIRFVSVEYAAIARTAFESLGHEKLSFHNIWTVFTLMMPLMYHP